MSKMKMLFGIPYTKDNGPLIDRIQEIFKKNKITFEVKEIEIDSQETHLHFFVREIQKEKAKSLVMEVA